MEATNELNVPGEYEKYFTLCAPTYAKVAPENCLQIFHNITELTATFLGAYLKMAPLFDEMEKLPYLDMAVIREFNHYAMGMAYAEVRRYRLSVASADDLQERAGTAVKQRTALHIHAQALALDGTIVIPEALKEQLTSNSYAGIATSLLGLADLLKSQWPLIQNKCNTNLQAIQSAISLAEGMIATLGERQAAKNAADVAGLLRDQAYTFCVTTYEQIRRAVTFLRWDEGDVDDITPSIYAHSTSSKKTKKDTETAKSEVPKTQATTTATSSTTSSATSSSGAGFPNADPLES
jgi:hypothetical protein